jgi:hypothetical protein
MMLVSFSEMDTEFLFTKTDGSRGLLDLGTISLNPDHVLAVFPSYDYRVRITTMNDKVQIMSPAYGDHIQAKVACDRVLHAWAVAKNPSLFNHIPHQATSAFTFGNDTSTRLFTPIQEQAQPTSHHDSSKVMFDIGVWVPFSRDPSSDLLHSSAALSSDQVRHVVSSVMPKRLTTNPMSHPIHPPSPLLSADQCRDLVKYIEGTAPQQEDNHSDFQQTISIDQLRQQIGKDSFTDAAKVFGEAVDEIKLRRVSAGTSNVQDEHCIAFHLDHNRKTMSVALNNPDDYQGGRIVYALPSGEILRPTVTAGRATIHDCSLVHGVTRLSAGTRYHLFFLSH